jgi:hypothetical protein
MNLGCCQDIKFKRQVVRWRPAIGLSVAVRKLPCSEVATKLDWLSNDMKFSRTSPSPELPDFHPDTVIRDWGDGHAFRLADAQTGVIAFGGTGSGKTSAVARHLAFGYMANKFGGLVLCGKREESLQWQKWAADCGRSDDVIIVNADGDWRYNFMEDEASRPGEGGGFTINIVGLLDEIAGALAGGDKGETGGDNKIWEDALHTLNSNAVELPVLAGLKVSLPLLREITSSAATSLEQVKDPEWQKRSVYYKILQEADKATENGDPEIRADFQECRTYWLTDFPSYSDKTRSSIMMGFTVLIHPLVTRPLRKLFSSDTNVRPEDAFDGKIILVGLPVQEYRLVGRIANLIWKYCFQCAVLRRMQPADRQSFLRPVFLWPTNARTSLPSSTANIRPSPAPQADAQSISLKTARACVSSSKARTRLIHCLEICRQSSFARTPATRMSGPQKFWESATSTSPAQTPDFPVRRRRFCFPVTNHNTAQELRVAKTNAFLWSHPSSPH